MAKYLKDMNQKIQFSIIDVLNCGLALQDIYVVAFKKKIHESMKKMRKK